ncbi:MAG TPA: alpha/beta hydrolase [Pirellulaceae bacterium]|nr:alpha/beta hydrolase [Pirellulaceae bacterium]
MSVTTLLLKRLTLVVAIIAGGYNSLSVFGQQVLGLDDALIQTLVPADANCCRLIPGDQLWVISTRQSGESCACSDPEQVSVQVMQFVDCHWRGSTWEALQRECAQNGDLTNLIYVHGNFTDFGWSLRRGCQLYENLLGSGGARGRRLCNRSGCAGQVCRCQPVRVILWSWQSEREALPPCDFWIKSDRAQKEGARFNAALRDLPMERPVVIGYSLGVQVILAALLQDEAAADRSPWRVALLAPVLNCDFPAYLCQTMSLHQRVESMVLFTNCRDRALKTANRAVRLRTRSTPYDQYHLAARLSQLTSDFRQYEIGCESGGKHAIVHYTEQSTVQVIVRELFQQAHPQSDGSLNGPPEDQGQDDQ